MADVLKEFLVSLGYRLDEASERRMLDSVVRMTGAAVKLGLAVEAAAAGVVVGVAKIASQLEQLYFMSQRTQSSVANINAFAYAVSQLGGSTEGATSSLENFAKQLRNPGTRGFIEQTIGHPVRDAATALTEFAAKAAEMPQYIGDYWTQMVGIDDLTWQAMKHNIVAFQKEHSAMVKAIGYNEEQAAKNSTEFMQRLRALQDLSSSLLKKIGSDLAGQFSADIEAFRKAVIAHSDQIQHVIQVTVQAIITAASAFSRLIVRLIQGIGDLFTWFDKLDPKMKAVLETIGLIVAAWYLLNRGFLSTPLGIVATLITALVALYDDYKTWKEHGKSLIDWTSWEPSITAATNGIQKLGTWLKDFYTNHEGTVKAFGALIATWVVLNSVMANSPITLIIAFASAILGLIVDYERWQETGKVGLIDWPKWKPYIESALEYIDKIATSLDSIVQSVGGWQTVMTDFMIFVGGKWLFGIMAAFGRVFGLTHALNLALGGIGGGAFATLIVALTQLAGLLGLLLIPTNNSEKEAGELKKFQEENSTDSFAPDPALNAPEKKKGWFAGMGEWMGLIPKSAPITGKEQKANARESYQFWRGKGLDHQAALAMLGAEQKESGFNPGDIGDGGMARGSFQWHPDRRIRIKQATGIDIDDPKTTHTQNLEAAYWEMTHDPDQLRRGTWRQLTTPNVTIPQSAQIIQDQFERSANPGGSDVAKTISMGEAIAPLVSGPPSLATPNVTTHEGDKNVTQNNNITVNGKPTDQDMEKIRTLVNRLHSDTFRYQGGAVR